MMTSESTITSQTGLEQTVMDISLLGKMAVVCGSTQGIGKAAAVELASLGAQVVLVARNVDSLKMALSDLPKSDAGPHDYLVADFADSEQLEKTLRQFLDRGQVAHILVNNTGGPPGGAALSAAVDEFTRAFRHHLVCNQILAQALVPGMKQAKYGRIINVISTSVKQPIPGLGVSNTIRGAVANWAKTLATELGPFGITVNNVLPGFTATSRLSSLIASRAKNENTSEEKIAEGFRNCIPAGRFAEPYELGAAIAFLATPSAAYINGINLPVDGGRTTCL